MRECNEAYAAPTSLVFLVVFRSVAMYRINDERVEKTITLGCPSVSDIRFQERLSKKKKQLHHSVRTCELDCQSKRQNIVSFLKK